MPAHGAWVLVVTGSRAGRLGGAKAEDGVAMRLTLCNFVILRGPCTRRIGLANTRRIGLAPGRDSEHP